jgi:hypothetical protein
MAAGATGEVEDSSRWGRPQLAHELHVTCGLAGIAVGVEIQVLLAEPFFVPGSHGRMIPEA